MGVAADNETGGGGSDELRGRRQSLRPVGLPVESKTDGQSNPQAILQGRRQSLRRVESRTSTASEQPEVRVDMCTDMCADMSDMCADVCADMCADMCIDMCLDMLLLVSACTLFVFPIKLWAIIFRGVWSPDPFRAAVFASP